MKTTTGGRTAQAVKNRISKMGYVVTEVKRTNKKPFYNNMNSYRVQYHKKK